MQVRIKSTSTKDHSVEIQYCAAQACFGPSPSVLADEITKQVMVMSLYFSLGARRLRFPLPSRTARDDVRCQPWIHVPEKG